MSAQWRIQQSLTLEQIWTTSLYRTSSFDYTVTDGEKDPVNPLIYLYPDIPRDVAFGRYYTSASEGKDFYIHIYALHMCNGPLLTVELTLELTYTGKKDKN